MWSRITGKSNDADSNTVTQRSRRKSDDQASKRHRAESAVSSTSTREKVSKEGDRDRGFTPTSTSFASTTKNPYPNTASPSVALSYSVVGDQSDGRYIPPGLVRNASLADQMPKSKAGHDERDPDRDRNRKSEGRRERSLSRDRTQGKRERLRSHNRGEKHREKKETRDKKDKDRAKERGLSRSGSGCGDDYGTSRALPDFTEQVGSAGFMQFPGQYDAGFVGGPQVSSAGISSHVQDQFPGQFPMQTVEPYRPPLAVSEGGPGLAAEYYGDAGQSVSDQPGVRLHSPSLIIGAEPHLQAASAVAAPPPEPSTTGGVGAAASFFSGSFTPEPVEGPSSTQAPVGTDGPSFYHDSNTYASTSKPDPSNHSSSAPAVPTLGAAAAGAAAGYLMGGGQPSQLQRPEQVPPVGTDYNVSSPPTYQRPPSHLPSISGSPTNNSKPTKPGKHSSQSANIPIYAAGAAGLAAAALHNSPHTSAPSHPAAHDPSIAFMAQQHRHRGPLSKFMDFFKDPEGVAQFEEYTEYIGICRYCFAPGSSPRDAPRKHHYRRRRSNEHLGSTMRVDKESRYGSSDGEGRRRNKKSTWLAAGVTGYGLAKVGESIFNQKNDFDDTYSVKTGHPSSNHGTHGSHSPDRRSITSRGVTRRSSDTHSRQRSRSGERVEKGVTRDGRVYKKDSHGSFVGGPSTTVYGPRHESRAKSRSRSRSRDRRKGVAGAVLGAAVGSSAVVAGGRPRSRSPKKAFVRPKQRSGERSPDLPSVLRVNHSENHHGSHRSHNSLPSSHRHKSHKKEKKGGYFTFGNGSSSSSDVGGFFSSGREKQRSSKKSKAKGKDTSNADVALMGAAAAAAALALSEGRQGNKSKRMPDLVALKESKGKLHRGSHRDLAHKNSTMQGPEDQLWESASEDGFDSDDSALAYGMSARRRRSQESLSSESSGMGIWGWRWGSKKKAKDPAKVNRQNGDKNLAAAAAAATSAGLTSSTYGMSSVPNSQRHEVSMHNDNSVPLQLVHSVPTSDPSRFDVTRANSIVSSQPIMYSRPGPVPIQHPQPIAPVSQSVYSAQIPYGHSYSAPTGPPVFSQGRHSSQPPIAGDSRQVPFNVSRVDVPESFPHDPSPHRDPVRDVKPRRRDTSPAAPSTETILKSTTPRRRSSLKEESSAVSFDLTKEQEDKGRLEKRRESKEDVEVRLQRERREKHRQGKEDEELRIQRDRREKRRQAREEELRIENQRREAAEQKQIDKDRIASRSSIKESPFQKDKSWVAPVTAGAVAAAVGAAVAAESSKKAAHRGERQEKRERERMASRDESATSHRQTSPEGQVEYVYDANEQSPSTQQKSIASVPQAVPKTGTTDFEYEDYASFFTPPELFSSSREPKERIASPNADNDITVDQTPEIITREPSRLHGSSRTPAFSYAPDELASDRVYPSWVPKLNLIEPTPPASRASSTRGAPSPVMQSTEEIIEQEREQTPKSTTPSKVTWGEPETREYTVITPMEPRDQFIDSQRETDSEEDIIEVQDRDGRSSQRHIPPADGVRADHEPGYYGDDLEFAATLAAGLEGTGFDPAIVVDDPIFRRRDSPPRSEKVSVAEEASIAKEASHRQLESPKRDSKDPPRPTMPGSFDNEEDFGPKLSEKDGKKKDKAARCQGAADPSTEQHIDELSSSRRIEFGEREPLDQKTADTFDEVDDRSRSEKKKFISDILRENGLRETYVDGNAASESRTAGDGSFASAVSIAKALKLKDQQREATEDLPGDIPLPVGDDLDDLDHRTTSGLLDDDYYNDKKSKSEHSRAGRSRDESVSDDAPSVAATAPVSIEKGDGKKHRKKSKRNSSGFDDAASVASSPAAIDDSRDSKRSSKKEKERKGGLFGLFSKPTDNLSEPQRSKVVPEEATFDDFEEPKKKKKKSRDRKSSRDDEISSLPGGDLDKLEDDEEKDESHRSRDRKEKRRSSGGSTIQDTGRITQDLPAKDREYSSERTSSGNSKRETDSKDKQVSMSFLGMRQEIPPSPNIPTATPKPPGHRTDTEPRDIADLPTYAVDDLALLEENRRTILADRERHVSVPSASNSQPTSPLSHPEGSRRRLSDVKTLDNTKASANTASPTAVPFRWKEPPLSPGFSRSSPSTPLSSLNKYPDIAPTRSKIRPRSTEFKASTEFRPLWLVERHGSRQEPASEEVYPSLPSSHTTSRASSIHDPEDVNVDQDTEYDLTQPYFEPVGERQGLVIDTEKATVQPDLLDSQEPTPTASSFHAAERGDKPLDLFQELPSGPVGEIIPLPSAENSVEAPSVPGRTFCEASDPFFHPRQASPSRNGHEPPPQLFSAPAEVSADNPPKLGTSHQEAAEAAAIIDGSTAVAIAKTSHYDQQPEPNFSETHLGQPHEEDKALLSDVDGNAVDNDGYGEVDFSIEKPRKTKKDKKRSDGNSNQETELPTFALESGSLSSSKESSRLSVEESMRLQEKDTQDAVDPWFASVATKKSKKDKKGKKKGQGADVLEEPQAAAALEAINIEPAKEPAIGFEDEEEAKLEISTRAIKFTSEDPTNLAKPSESDHLTKELPLGEMVNVMATVGQGTNISKVESPKSDPVEHEWQAFGGKSKKKGKKNKKASSEPWEDSTIKSPRPDVVKPSDTDMSFAETKQQDEAVHSNNKSAAEASRERAQNPEATDEQLGLGALEVPYEFPLLSKKKGKKGRKKAESTARPDTPLEAPLESPQHASGYFDREQNPFETSLMGQGTAADVAPNCSEPLPTPREELASAFAPTKKIKKGRKGQRGLRELEGEDPAVLALEEAKAPQIQAADPGFHDEDESQDRHSPKFFSTGNEVKREDQESINSSIKLQTDPWGSPESTPLPFGDDLDLLDALPENPLIVAADLGNDDLDNSDHRNSDQPNDGSLSLDHNIERELVSPEATPLPADADLDLLYAWAPNPIFNPTEVNKEVVRLSDIEIRDFPSTINTREDPGFIDEVSREKPVQNANEGPVDYSTFPSKKKIKKGKKGKQSLSLEQNLDLAPEEGSRTSEVENVQAPDKDLRVEGKDDKGVVQNLENPISVDESAAPSKKGKKGKKQSLLAGTSQALQPQEKDLSALPPSSDPSGRNSQAWDVTDKPDYEIPQEPLAEDEWASISKKKGKMGKRQQWLVSEAASTLHESDESEPSNLEPLQSEIRGGEPQQLQAEIASDASFVDDLLRLRDKEGLTNTDTKPLPTFNEPLMVDRSDPQGLAEDIKEQPGVDERAVPTKKKKEKKGRKSNFQDFEDSPIILEAKDEKSIEDASTARTDTTREVQDMLAEANETSASSDPLGESVDNDKALMRDSMDELVEKADADELIWRVPNKKGKKDKKSRLLRSDDLITDDSPLRLRESQPGSLSELMPLTEERPIETHKEGPLEGTENEDSRPFTFARTQSEPINSPDRGSNNICLNPPIIPVVVPSIPEAKETEQSRAVSPETAALLSRDDEKPPGALKAAEIVPDPGLDQQNSSDIAPVFESEIESSGTPLAPIFEGQVSIIEERSIAPHTELSPIKESTTSHTELSTPGPTDNEIDIPVATEVVPNSFNVAQGDPEYLPPLSKKDKKRAKKGRKIAWDDGFDSPTPESEALPETSDAQQDLASEAPEVATNVQRDLRVDDFEGFSKSTQGKRKSNKEKSWNGDLPPPTPERESAAIVGQLREGRTDDNLKPPKATSDNVVADEFEDFGKSKKDRKNAKKEKASIREEDVTPKTPKAEFAPEIIETQNDSIDESTSLVTDEQARPATDGSNFVPRSKKDKKKTKKSKALSWEDEGTGSTPESLEMQEPTRETDDPATVLKLFHELGEPPGPKESDPSTEDFTIAPKSKKGRKKSKPSKALSWGNENASEQLEVQESIIAGNLSQAPASVTDMIRGDEPSTGQVAAEKAVQEAVISTAPPPQGALETVTGPRAEQKDEPEPSVDPVFSLKKRKKDKKKAKGAQAFNWDEEVAQAEAAQTNEESSIDMGIATSTPIPYADQSPIAPPQHEVVQESGHIGFVQPFDELTKSRHFEERERERKPAVSEDIHIRRLSEAKQDPPSIYLEQAMVEPREKDHPPDLPPIENLPRASIHEPLSPRTASTIYQSLQDHQASTKRPFDTSQGNFADRDIGLEGRFGIVEPDIAPIVDAQQTNTDNEDDDLWDVSVEKGENRKKRHKDKSAASETPRVLEEPNTLISEAISKVLESDASAEQPATLQGQATLSGSGETSKLAMIRDYDEQAKGKDVEISVPTPSQPIEEKHEPDSPASDIKDSEDQGLRFTAVESEPLPQDDFSTFPTTRKSKRGKKSKKQQAPVIWEDDTATEPAANEVDPIVHRTEESSRDQVPVTPVVPPDDYIQESVIREANEEQRMQQEHTYEHYADIPSASDEFRGTVDETKHTIDASDDYFNIPHSEESGRVSEQYKTQLSKPQEHLEKDLSAKPQESRKPLEASESTDMALETFVHKTASGPLYEQQTEPDWGYASTKQGKKAKKSKKRDVGLEAETPPTERDLSTKPQELQRSIDALEIVEQIPDTTSQGKDLGGKPSSEKQAEEDWGYTSTKKGKKAGKSRKIGTDVGAETPPPIEQVVSAEPQNPQWSMEALEISDKAPQMFDQERPPEEMGQANSKYTTTKAKGGKKSKKQEVDLETETSPSFGLNLSTEAQEVQRSLHSAKSIEQARDIAGQKQAGEEQSEADWGYAPVKKGRKGKKPKSKDVDMEVDTPSSGSWRIDDPSEGLSKPPESRSMERMTAAAGLGLGIVATEALQRKDSKEGKKGKKNKKASKWAEFEIDEAPKPSEQDSYSQAQALTQEERPPMIPSQHFQDTPPLSPPDVSRESMMESVSHEARALQSSYPVNRDSAIQMSDSPILSRRLSDHRIIRDSGFQDMETSPAVVAEPEDDYKTGEREIKAGIEPYQQDLLSQQYGIAPSDNPIDVSVEVSPEYAISVSRPRPEGDYHDLYSDNDHRTASRQHGDLPFDDLREPSPVSSTTKDRSSVLFQSSPSTREDLVERPRERAVSPVYPITAKDAGHQASRDVADEVRSSDLPPEHSSVVAAERALHMTSPTGPASTSLFGGPVGIASDVKSPPRSPFSPDGSNRRRLDTITEYSPEDSPLHKKGRHLSDVGLPEHGIKSLRRSGRPQALSPQRVLSPPAREEGAAQDLISTDDLIAGLSWPPVDEDKHAVDLERSRSRSRNTDLSHRGNGPPAAAAVPRESERRSVSGASIRSGDSINAIIRTPDQGRSVSGQSFRSSGTPPLRRVDHRVSGDLRLANRKSEAKLAKELEAEEHDMDIVAIPSSSTYDPINDKGKTKVRHMADVYEGWGDVHGQSPISPTRPPSIRRRQSLQVLDLETKLDQVVSENRLLQNAKSHAERSLEEATRSRNSEIENYQAAIQTRDSFLSQKDAELNQLKHALQGLQSQVAQLTEANQGLSETSRGVDDHEQRYSQLESEHANTHRQWQRSIIELDELRQQRSQLSAGMEDIVRHEVNVALEEKNLELRKVHDELEATKEQVRVLQRQILAAKNSDDLIIPRDEDYFDEQCQKLCQHVQQWVLRFSKFSDMRACFLASEIRDETVVDRFENAILDGSDVDSYLVDRVKRRDVFMSVVMTMIFDYIFTRYLFGMDREQRQKLKSLQSTLSEVGPMTAVHKWRATTLTLLSRREAFAAQRAQDTEAVMEEIYNTLATFLPPPSHLVNQIQDSLRKVIGAAVDLHIEMRTQRAEYVMLPPLQPEYDTNGDLARKVYFNAALMNERSGDTLSNDALEAQHAVVRMVLFPLVVKRGDDSGIGDEEIVVCPAQVLTAKPGKEKKTVRVMSVAGSTAGGRSVASLGGSDVGMVNMI